MPSCLLQDLPAVELKLPAGHRVIEFNRRVGGLVPVDDPVNSGPQAGNIPLRILGEEMIDLPALELRHERLLDEGVEVLVPGLLRDVPIFVR